MIAGTIYGVALNDLAERQSLAAAFQDRPYNAPPVAPVVYIKPRACLACSGAPVLLSADMAAAQISSTIALLFARDATKVRPGTALAHVGAACVAADVGLPKQDYFRPATTSKIRDGSLPFGAFAPLPAGYGPLVTSVDGVEAHRWSLDRLVRPIDDLIVALSEFMTLRAGDLLLVGLPGDAPLAQAGQTVEIHCDVLPTLRTRLVETAA